MHGATRRTLLKIKGFSEVKVEKIKDAIQKCQVPFPGLVTVSLFFCLCYLSLAICVGFHHRDGAGSSAEEGCQDLYWEQAVRFYPWRVSRLHECLK